MKYILNITPEELLTKKFYIDFCDDYVKFEKEKGIFDEDVYILSYDDSFEFLFQKMVYGWLLEFKTTWLGTNSDNFYIGSIAINILGQMLEQNIIKFDSEVENE